MVLCWGESNTFKFTQLSQHKTPMFTNHLQGLALLAAIILVGTNASATTYTVTNTDAGFTTGSLHWAVGRANNSDNPEAGKVVFDPSLNGLTITLSSQLEIPRSAGVIIDASDLPGGITVSAATMRILYVNRQNAVVHLRGITFDGGNGKGNPTDGGGAIYSVGTLTATDCTFTNNTSPTAGGAIWNTATGTLMLERCVFSNNTAPNSGGAIYNEGTIATMHLCTFSDNAASNGGAIYNGGSLTATKSFFTDNVGSGPGGGISNTGPLTLTQCSITGNTSGIYGGGIYTATPIGSATVRAVLSQCTLSGNTADAGGGGIHNQLGTTTLDHCTVSANTAPVDFASGVGARQSNFTEVIISNSIIAGNTNTDIDDTTIGGSSSFTSGGYNIVGTGGGTPSFTNNDQVGVDPLLHPLADNGSLTPTMALRTGSPAIDAATTSANTEDQRGIPVRNSPDIGAFESGSVVVTTTVDEYDRPSGPDVSLREALRDMDFGPSGQPVVLFANALAGQTITLTRGPVDAFDCIIDASPLAGGITISGGNASLVMYTGNNSTLNQLTITGGSGTNNGGGIGAPGGTVTMNDCTITGNTTTGGGGGIYASGAVIYLNRCTISNNTAGFSGGGIYLQNADQVTFTRCTLTGNSASYSGSAIMNNSLGSVTLIHSTISQNIVGETTAPAIYLGGTSALSIENSIVADNGIGVDFGPGLVPPNINVSGKNIVGKNTNVAADFPADGILIGTSAAPVLPRLNPLADNGGLTRTMALQIGSVAIGSSTGSTSSQDQRGVDVVGVADIGAFETSALTVNTLLDELDVPAGPNLSLREALRDAAGANASGIVFHPSLSGQTITLGGTQLLAESDIAIDASGLPEGITINGNQASRILEVAYTRYLSLRNLTLTGGFANGDGVEGHGGAIYNRGRLDLHGVTIHGNTANNSGGAIYHQKVGSLEPSTLTLTRCTISGNSATWGGGIFNQSTAVLNHCTVTANTSSFNSGPGIYNHYSSGPSLTINNCIVAGNTDGDFSSADISSDSSQFTSLGANLIGDDSAVTGLTGDDIVNPAPLLAPLADNGGPTRTHALLNGSPAINAAIGTADSADQRGFPISGVADIGAYEADISNADLKDLITSMGAFDRAVPASGWFSIDVGYLIDTATFTPTAVDPSSTITVDGSPVPSGTASDPIALALGNQTIKVVVTSHDASTTKTYDIYVTRLPATTDSNGNGFSDLQEFLLGNLPSRFYVGDVVSFDLAAIFYPMPLGQTLAVTGLPPGVRFDRTTGLVSGTVLGLGRHSGVVIKIKQGRRVLHALLLDLALEPYRPAGSYEVLLEDGGLPVGKLKLTISSPSTRTPNPAYTATLQRLGERRRIARGRITPGASPLNVSVVFPAFRKFPAVSYSLVISNDSDLVTGATNPVSSVTARGFRLAKAARIPGGNPALTLSFPPYTAGDRTTTPGGIGYARGKVNSKALIPLSGLLGDAQAFTSSLCLSQTNQAVVWLTPYKNKPSYFGGIIDIGTLNVPGRSPATESATTGLKWARVLDATATSYPNGFGPFDLNANTSRWYSVPRAEALAQALGLTFRGINVTYFAPTADVMPARLSLRDNLRLLGVAPTNAVPFTGRALGTRGIFSGRLRLPAPATASTMSGVFLQDESFGVLIGQGLVKIPIAGGVKGSYQTMGIELEN